MKIGVLNSLLNGIECSVSRENSVLDMQHVTLGNPAKGEKISIKWDVVRNMSADVNFDFFTECFVDRVEVTVSDVTCLKSVSLKNDGKTLFVHRAETGKIITDKTIVLEAGSVCKDVTVSFESDFSDVEILSVAFYGALFEDRDVFPTPDEISFGGKTVPLAFFDSFSAGCPEAERAAEVLNEKYNKFFGICPSKKDGGKISFGKNVNLADEAFTVDVDENGAKICASTLRGFVMGAETFIKLCKKDGVAVCSVKDAPAYPFRGVHLFLPSERSMPYAKRLIKYLVSPMGYNHVIIEIAGGMRFDSHPEINEAVIHANKMNDEGKWPEFPHAGVAERGCISKELAGEFVEYIRSFGIDVIPEIQSLGHVQFMTLAHPEIAEVEVVEEELNIDTRNEDDRPKTFYKHSYCPSNPKSYEILFDLMDEIIEVFKPSKYVHMGHDEVYQIGVCPVCKDKDPAQLYYNDVMKIYNYLKAKGLGMMIWSDMIQPVSNYRTRPAIDMLPKDIVMLDFIWYFHLDENIEQNLIDKGYSVAVGNLYSSHYPRFEERIRQKGMIGGQISAWVGTTESSMQREGKLYDYILTSQMLWSADYSKKYTLCYDRIINSFMPYFRQSLKNVEYPSLCEDAITEIIAQSDISFPPLSTVKQNVDIEVNGEYKSLVFFHTELKKLTRLPWQDYDVTGKYILTYDDGTVEEIAVTNNGIIGHWNRRHNEVLTHPLYRHTGYTCVYYTDGEEYKTADGENVCIYKYEHILSAGKRIKNVKLVRSDAFDTDIFLCKLVGVK